MSDDQLRDLVARTQVEVERRSMLRPDVVALQDRAAELLCELEADSALRILDEVGAQTVEATHDPVTLERLVSALASAIDEAGPSAADDGEDLPAEVDRG